MNTIKQFLSKSFYLTLIVICVFLSLTKVFAYQADKDPSFRASSSNWIDWAVNSIVIQDDGRLVFFGSFKHYQWIWSNRIVGISSWGKRDANFDVWSWFNQLPQTATKQTDWKIGDITHLEIAIVNRYCSSVWAVWIIRFTNQNCVP
jgi:hypothetical protein